MTLSSVPLQYRELVWWEAVLNGVSPMLFASLLEEESGFQPEVTHTNRNGSEDRGIAQLNSVFHDEFVGRDNKGNSFDPFNPEQAIPVAAHILARYTKITKSVWGGICAYNCGPTRYKQEPPASTIAYAKRIYQW
jgi:soluble lytic murein transglycosylase-like protein